jgi:hypothetical protein
MCGVIADAQSTHGSSGRTTARTDIVRRLPSITQPARNIPALIQRAPHIDVVVALNIENQIREALEWP